MNAQEIMLGSRVAHVRELKTEIAKLKAENAALRDETAALHAHFDLALLAADDLRRLPADGVLVLVDGWNRILGADRVAANPEELIARAKRRLEERPHDVVWIVFDGPRESVRNEGRLRVSYTGGTGPHRADRFICDYLRMARYAGSLMRLAVETSDKDFRATVRRLAPEVTFV